MTPGVSGSLGVTVANLNPRGMVGRIYIVNHCALLHTRKKYRSCACASWTHSKFKKKFFHIISLWKLMIPRGMAGTIYVGITRHYYILNI